MTLKGFSIIILLAQKLLHKYRERNLLNSSLDNLETQITLGIKALAFHNRRWTQIEPRIKPQMDADKSFETLKGEFQWWCETLKGKFQLNRLRANAQSLRSEKRR